ncbi:unnamed protein product [Leuciscus chuanchicus]
MERDHTFPTVQSPWDRRALRYWHFLSRLQTLGVGAPLGDPPKPQSPNSAWLPRYIRANFQLDSSSNSSQADLRLQTTGH